MSALNIQPPFNTIFSNESDQKFNDELLEHGLYDMDNEVPELYSREFWQDDFEVFIISRHNNESFKEIINKRPLTYIDGYWYGDQAITDAYAIFENTKNALKISNETVRLYFIIRSTSTNMV